MNLEDVRMTDLPKVSVSEAEIAAFESEHWIRFPRGYREFLLAFGEGDLSGVRVYPPWKIAAELSSWRRRIEDHWFWDGARDVLPKARALECVVLGDTIVGQELAFHPCRPDHVFVLSVDEETIVDCGSDLMAAVDRLCQAEPADEEPDPEGLTFTPYDSRTEEPSRPRSGADDPPGGSLTDIQAAIKGWIERHEAGKKGPVMARNRAGRGGKHQLLFEGIAVKANWPYDSGYVAMYQIVGPDGTERSRLACTFDEHGSGGYVSDDQPHLLK